MSLTLLQAAPAQILTTLDRVKAELGITGTAQDTTTNDDILAAIIGRASSVISRYCNRPYGFGRIQVTETIRGSGSQLLGVSQAPLLSVSQILQDTEVLTQVDPTQPTTPNFQDGYYIDDSEAGAIFRAQGWGQTVALMSWGWEAYASRYILPGGTQLQRYSVTYTAGYLLPVEQIDALSAPGTGNDALYDPTYTAAYPFDQDAPPLPGAVEEACLVTAKEWWFTRQRDYTIAAQQTADQRIQYAPRGESILPILALGLLRDARRPIAG